MADLAVGDFVFDESGAPTQILAATPPMLDRPCREALFSYGTAVVADAAHEWVTIDKNGRRYGPPARAVQDDRRDRGTLGSTATN